MNLMVGVLPQAPRRTYLGAVTVHEDLSDERTRRVDSLHLLWRHVLALLSAHIVNYDKPSDFGGLSAY